ncbi:MAG: TetR/AcrR family transcriptional regulator [Marmoricola sp.]
MIKVRADAQRNRDRIVEVARPLIRQKGIDAVSMDEIAKAAGVGPGTLYRHFPTKEALYDAVLEAWVLQVNDVVDKALTTSDDPRQQLLSWLSSYVELLTAHKGGAARITASLGDPGSPYATKCDTYLNANSRVLERLNQAQAVRPGIDAMQLCRLVGGIAAVADNSELDLAAIEPMLDVVADGILV